MPKRRKIVLAFLIAVIAGIAFVILSLGNARISPASLSFVGFTNAPSGLRLARFEVRNELPRRNTISGYCRVNSDIVDIMPTITLMPRQARIIDVPLTTHAGTPVDHLERVTFNGTRSLNMIEDLFLAFQEFLDSVGHKWAPSSRLVENRWELSYRFTSAEK